MLSGTKKNLKFKVAFAINFASQKWLGGYNIIVNLIEAILINKNSLIEPVLIFEKRFKINADFKSKKIKILKTNLFSHMSLTERIIEKFRIFFLGKSKKIESYLVKNKIYALSHTLLPLGKKSQIKSYPWIPDFQYIYYPNNFSLKNRIMKNINTFFCGNCSSKILLSSFDVKKDIQKISNKAFVNSKINRFTFNLPDQKEIKSLKYLIYKYKIPNKFFFVPNQYWVHKNHILILETLKKIVKLDKSICIISTGYKDDHRQSGYFSKLQRFIKTNKLVKNYLYLGTINYLDVLSLMYHSVAVLNPSKFEGWSSSVEQAKSMGKTILLSNINVHKEQKPQRGLYFNVNDSNKFKKLMMKTWKNHNRKNEKTNINFAYKNLKKRLISYAKDYENIIING